MRKLLMAYLTGLMLTLFSINVACALEGLGAIEPTVDFDFVVLQENQSTTVTADLSFIGDFEIAPVTLIGNGNFSASLSRNGTTGELVYIMLLGFGDPTFAANIGVTPVTLRASSRISDVDDGGLGLVVHGILFSMEDPPWEYSVSLSF